MSDYTVALRDIRFVIDEVLEAPTDWAMMPDFAHVDVDTAHQVLEEGARFATGVLAPINASGDLEGCRWEDGTVRTPKGYREAYAAYVAGGWALLACHQDDGGQGLPLLLDAAFGEMIAAANHGWTMYAGLLHGAYECLRAHGSADLQERYLAKIASGEWLATMNLTEPQAGSDLGLLRTRAEPGANGVHALTGNKIFISGGEHDLTENIVHLVLARLPGAPAGTRGISLFLAPKFLPDGSRNAIRCDGIEKKMGIKGSATCSMAFEGATGWLIGQPNRGLAAMFVMMNAARLHVGLQGLGHLDRAQRAAHAYAMARIQGRGKRIAEHPAIRRTLWRLRAMAEGGRIIAYWTAMLIDEAHHHPDHARRQVAHTQASLLTPVVKAFLTDCGHRGADDALQVLGGYGFIHDYGIEQIVRDSRIAMIYEGTNEIQAIDLVQRRIVADRGAALEALFARFEADTLQSDDEFGGALRQRLGQARAASAALVAGSDEDPDWPLSIADDVLRALGLTLLGWAWMRMARTARADSNWHQDKQRLARFGFQWVLPEAGLLWQRVQQRDLELPLAVDENH